MIVNKATFSDMAGISRPTVSLSIQRGKLVETAEGFIDTENETNAAYLEKRKGKPITHINAAKPPRIKKPAEKKTDDKKKTTTRIEPLDGVDLPIGESTSADASDYEGGDQLDKLGVDIRLKRAQARRHELKYEQDKGLLLPVESVERAAAKVGSEIKIRLQGLPRRITPRIIALVRSGSEDIEIQSTMEREIDEAIDAIRVSLGVTNE